jgi:hypothetical protein
MSPAGGLVPFALLYQLDNRLALVIGQRQVKVRIVFEDMAHAYSVFDAERLEQDGCRKG